MLKFIETQLNKERDSKQIILVSVTLLLLYNLYIKTFQVVLFFVYREENKTLADSMTTVNSTFTTEAILYAVQTLIFYAVLQEILFRLPLASKYFNNLKIASKLLSVFILSTISFILFYYLEPNGYYFHLFVESIVYGFFASFLFIIVNKRFGYKIAIFVAVIFNFLTALKIYLQTFFV